MIENILKGPEISSETTNQSLGEFFFNSATKYGEKICQIEATTGVSETFASVKLRSIRLAIALQHKNITPDDIIVQCTKNHLNSIIPVLGSFFIGAKVASLDCTLHEKDVSQLMKVLNPKIVFVDEEAVSLIEKSSDDPNLIIVVIGKSNKYLQFSEFQIEQANENDFKPVKVDPSETAFLFLSSGTTGPPKGICISHRSFYYAFLTVRQLGIKTDVITHFTTLYWVSAAGMMGLAFYDGSTRILSPSFEPELALKIFDKYKVTLSFISPFLANKIILCPNTHKYDLSSLHCLMVGGGPFSKHQRQELSKIMPKTHLVPCYGLTEAGYVSFFDLNKDLDLMEKKHGSSGPLCPGVLLKIVDLQSGKKLGAKEKGEIYVKTMGLMNGYYKMDYSNAFDKDGFLKTGDYGYYDEDECIYVVDRIKDIIEYQEWHVIPAAIEAVLLRHRDIKETVVFGLPDKEDFELPAALVVLREDSKLTEDEIHKYINDNVHDRERLRGGIWIVPRIPRTPSGKVKKWFVRDYVLNKLKM